jgi:hypothetical protein
MRTQEGSQHTGCCVCVCVWAESMVCRLQKCAHTRNADTPRSNVKRSRLQAQVALVVQACVQERLLLHVMAVGEEVRASTKDDVEWGRWTGRAFRMTLACSVAEDECGWVLVWTSGRSGMQGRWHE